MHITILTIGSRGDVEPYIALGLGLQQAGHIVRLATHATFKPMIQEQGLEFAPIKGDSQELMQTEAGQALQKSSKNLFAFARNYSKFVKIYIKQALADCWQACQGTDAIIAAGSCVWGFDIAEQQGIPCYLGSYLAATPTKAFPIPFTPPWIRLGGIYNQLTYLLIPQFFWLFFRPYVNQWRQSMLLPPIPMWQQPFRRMDQQGIPFLYGYSPSILPRDPAWAERIHVTGYWFLESPPDFSPPQDLVDFLAAGSPPVSIGFGSMRGTNSKIIMEIALEALIKTGQRGILITGQGGISHAHLPDEVLKVESIPYGWLFPRVACVVHHGATGATAFGLRAGVPTIIIPFLSDQLFWGYQLKQLGVGQFIPKQKLTVERLADAIKTAIEDRAMRSRARALGEKIRLENGVEQAVKAFHQHLPAANKLTNETSSLA